MEAIVDSIQNSESGDDFEELTDVFEAFDERLEDLFWHMNSDNGEILVLDSRRFREASTAVRVTVSPTGLMDETVTESELSRKNRSEFELISRPQSGVQDQTWD